MNEITTSTVETYILTWENTDTEVSSGNNSQLEVHKCLNATHPHRRCSQHGTGSEHHSRVRHITQRPGCHRWWSIYRTNTGRKFIMQLKWVLEPDSQRKEYIAQSRESFDTSSACRQCSEFSSVLRQCHCWLSGMKTIWLVKSTCHLPPTSQHLKQYVVF